MDNTELIIIVALFALVTIVELVLHYMDRAKYAELLSDVGRVFFERADVALAPLGVELEVVNEAAYVLESLIDEDTDALTVLLPAEMRSKLREVLDRVDALTDGEAGHTKNDA